MFKPRLLLASILGLALVCPGARADHTDNNSGWADEKRDKAIVAQAAALSWSSKAAGPLRQLLSKREAAQAFLNYLYGYDEFEFKGTTGKYAPAHLGDYRLIDLNNDGRLELLATADFTGRAFYETLAVFTNKNGQIQSTDLTDRWAINDLDAAITDLDHDGRKELLLDREPNEYRGTETIPGLTDIYHYDGSRLIQVDRQFKDYYRKDLLPRLQQRLADFTAGADELEKEVTTAQNKLRQEKLAADEQESLHDELNHNTSILKNYRGNIVDLQAQLAEVHRLLED